MNFPQFSKGARSVRDSMERLREHTSAWRRDERDRANNWRILYAVDSDTVLMYTSLTRSQNFGRVFDNDTERTAVCVVNLLSDALFFPEAISGNKGGPRDKFYVIPPHDEELRNVMQSVAWNAQGALEGMMAKGVEHYAELLRVFDTYRGSTPEEDFNFARQLRGHAKDLIDLSNQVTGALTTQDRFVKLSNKLFNIWNATINAEYVINVDETQLRIDTFPSTTTLVFETPPT